jgi:hypothetical protein
VAARAINAHLLHFEAILGEESGANLWASEKSMIVHM